MDPSRIPDDIWTEIFEFLPRRQLVANVQRTCRRFRTLATDTLLRHILWFTPAQIEEELLLWSTVNANRVTLPRTLCITLRLEVDAQTQIWDSVPISIVSPFLDYILLLSAYICRSPLIFFSSPPETENPSTAGSIPNCRSSRLSIRLRSRILLFLKTHAAPSSSFLPFEV
jgi:hypothetical protein